MYSLGSKSLERLVGVHPTLAFAVMEAIKRTKQDFSVTEGVRTSRRQRELVNSGMSKTMNSYHLYGLAVDIVPYVNGKLSWEERYFDEINVAMKEVIEQYDLPIDWGYDLWGWDMPHWQLTGKRNEYDVRKFAPHIFRG